MDLYVYGASLGCLPGDALRGHFQYRFVCARGLLGPLVFCGVSICSSFLKGYPTHVFCGIFLRRGPVKDTQPTYFTAF